MLTIVQHPDAFVRIERNQDGRTHRLSVEPKGTLFVPFKSWETAYPLDLVEHILRVAGPDYLCDEIRRDKDPRYLEHGFRWDILSYKGGDGRHAKILKPARLGVKDQIDLWYLSSRTKRTARTKRQLMWTLRAIKAATGLTMVPSLSLAIEKIR